MSLFLFKTVSPEDKSSMEAIFRLRYKVYVEEWGFEKAEDHPQGIESDRFDARAIQVATIRKADSRVVGTVRLIRDSAEGFPIERNMQVDSGPTPGQRGDAVEISRLCVTHEFNRRAEDRALHNDEYVEDDAREKIQQENRDPCNDVVMGMIRTLTRECRDQKIKYWYVAMARGLYILLRRRGIVFTPVGPEVNYHGLRSPYFGSVADILAKNQELSDIYHGRIS